MVYVKICKLNVKNCSKIINIFFKNKKKRKKKNKKNKGCQKKKLNDTLFIKHLIVYLLKYEDTEIDWFVATLLITSAKRSETVKTLILS